MITARIEVNLVSGNTIENRVFWRVDPKDPFAKMEIKDVFTVVHTDDSDEGFGDVERDYMVMSARCDIQMNGDLYISYEAHPVPQVPTDEEIKHQILHDQMTEDIQAEIDADIINMFNDIIDKSDHKNICD